MQVRSVLHLCTEFGADCSIHSKVIEGGPEIRKLSHVTPPRLLRGRFMVPMHGGPVVYVHTKFEADSSFHSKVIRVPKFRNWVT